MRGIAPLVACQISALLIAGVWLVPLAAYYEFALGGPLPPEGLLVGLGSLNVVWLSAVIVGIAMLKRRPALAALSIAIFGIGLVSLTSLGSLISFAPYQSRRVVSSAILLGVIPLVSLVRDLLWTVFARLSTVRLLLLGGVLILGMNQPRLAVVGAGLPPAELPNLNKILTAVRGEPPGKVLVELFDPATGDVEHDLRERSLANVLSHSIARDGRPVVWSVFREHAVSAPFATAVRNLFSSTPEHYGQDGVAIRAAYTERVSSERALGLARSIGVRYLLLRSPERIQQFVAASGISLKWNIQGWHLLEIMVGGLDANQADARCKPVLALLPAKTKGRSPVDLEFFNIGERLAFDGRTDLCLIWGYSAEKDIGELWTGRSRLTVVASSSHPLGPATVAGLTGNLARTDLIEVLDRDDPHQTIFPGSERFRSVTRFVSGSPTSDELIRKLATEIAGQNPEVDRFSDPSLWRIDRTYFPNWRTRASRPWMTATGTMAILSDGPPLLYQEDSLAVTTLSWTSFISGLMIAIALSKPCPKLAGKDVSKVRS